MTSRLLRPLAILVIALAAFLGWMHLGTLDIATRAAPLIEQGFMAMDATHLRATPQGRVVLDRLLLELLA